ncbi:SDR family oxidoreductase [Nitratireductor kimnyeongensis]|uniref:SDR family oxidoreductase n=1 Tax=Nitratireductor kimnyeongensis TaxID=430679 RepID=A0ABW0T8B9_9HYPH|nr:SDR family oxidoreductase [Nitratireductor kimnyeongensis]QZZ36321.1 SDR family oxidoreductase [Nitratireductor kimnyeongensis]
MTSLNEKVAIVTGASAGIGRAAARLFARHGAKVVVTARRQAELDTLVDEIEANGGEALALAGDVREDSHNQKLVAVTESRFGGLDIAFNNAGAVGPLVQIDALERTDWNDVIETNLSSAFSAARYQVPAMRRRGGGSLIFTSSFVGYETAGMPGMAAYAASKAGLVGLVKSLASDLGHEAIRVNALLPGGTDTRMATFENEEERAFVEGMHALKRIARPEEIAQSALFLASDASSFTTGTAMLADGGVAINKV